ncbi:hypothetical protein GIB67_016880 [Kingdonia uniflora]|uniref:Mic1 domain-containing protein n=1 Tax=Kingdonia uniflora TaxID=39325 RepID=A0A7J7M3C0_9MAGN|nr:hypothetical protein GIB67_016880 [Kingdonia uniflora]
MFGATSKSQPGVASSGSGALSHVYIQHPPLRCNTPGSRGLYYDDGNKLLLSLTSDQVLAWDIAQPTSHNALSADSIGEGPVLSIRFSLDRKVIGIQRSNHEIQFINRESRETFTQRCRSDAECIVGFFWTDCRTCDLIFIKTSGLDLYSYVPELKALRLVETKKLSVSWYVYTHESRMVLLASGMQCKTFTGFQFSFAGVVRLPRFEMGMAKYEANKKPVLAVEDVHIVTIYGRIYSLQVDRVAMLLHLYRFYRDAVVQQGSVPIYSSRIAVSVIDNVLLVHQVDAKVVILYDVYSDSRAPISAPLPLRLKGYPKANASSSRTGGKDMIHMETNEVSDHEGNIYGDAWVFLNPDLICDNVHGHLWRIHLDLEAIAASSSEVSSVLEFLQRRKLESIQARQLSLAIMRTLILERRPIPMVSRAIDVLVASYSHSIKTGSSLQGSMIRAEIGGHGENGSINRDTWSTVNNRSSTCSDPGEDLNNDLPSEVSGVDVEQSALQSQTLGNGGNLTDISGSQVSAAISSEEMYISVFALVEEEMASEPVYLLAIITEYFRSAASEKVRVNPNLNVMTVQLLACSERYAELGLFIVNKIVEPSKEVALQLLESGRQHCETRKLGMDMLRQLSLHHDYVLMLVQDGYYLEALRYARKNKVNTIRPSLFLEAAFASNDSQHLAAVLRFFSDFLPGFKNTSDHSTYCHYLNEMNSSYIAA